MYKASGASNGYCDITFQAHAFLSAHHYVTHSEMKIILARFARFKVLFKTLYSLLLSFVWNLSNILATEMQLKLCFQGCSSLKYAIFHSTG